MLDAGVRSEGPLDENLLARKRSDNREELIGALKATCSLVPYGRVW
jgi:hypothetical protein